MGYNTDTIMKLRKFRLNMGSDLYFEDAKRIFKSNITFLKHKPEHLVSKRKLEYAKENSNLFKIFNWVRFVGVTGSVGAEIAKEDDDIDVMVVVKNGTSWLYRGFLLLKSRKARKVRIVPDGPTAKDLFCVNLIVEERATIFERDLFDLHELFWIKPIFNEEYMNNIILKNEWVRQYGAVLERLTIQKEGHNILWYGFNTFAFLFQLWYMKHQKHNPETKRLWKNFVRGKIEFFPVEFKNKILSCV